MKMHKMNRALLLAVVLATGAVVGCGNDQGDGNTVTSVRHNPDGTTSVNTVWMSSAELAQLDSQRTALAAAGKGGAAPSLDTGCAGASIWIYDNYWQTGNRICFAGPGDDYLANYAAPGGGNWSNANKSYWGGAYDGSFTYSTGSLWVFSAWEQGNGPGAGYNKLHQQ